MVTLSGTGTLGERDMAKRLVTLIVSLVTAVSSISPHGLADEPEPRPEKLPIASRVIEEVTVRRIQFPILALDKDGAPVTDLRPDEITLTIRGDEARIDYLDSVRPRVLTEERSLPFLRLSLDGGDIAETDPNIAEQPRAAVLFLDTTLEGRHNLRDGLDGVRAFVDELISGSDLTAVFSYGREFRLEASFTTNRDRLREAVTRAYENRHISGGRIESEINRITKQLELCAVDENGEYVPLGSEPALYSGDALMPDARCLKVQAASYLEQHRRPTKRLMEALMETVRYARGLDGPVTVYAMTHGAMLDPARVFEEMVRAVYPPSEDRDEALLSLPALDNIGLMKKLLALVENERVSFAIVDPTIAPAGNIAASKKGFNQSQTRPVEVAFEAAQQVSRAIARDTGGIFLEERNLLEGMRKAAHLESGRYYLGVTPPSSLREGARIRRVRAKCSRPGVKLRIGRGAGFRSGHTGDLAMRFALPRRQSLDAKGELVVQPFTLGFRAADLEYINHEGQAIAEMTVHIRVETLEGERIAHVFHDLHHLVESGNTPSSGVLTLTGKLEAPPGRYRLIAFLRSLQGEQRATAVREIDVTEIVSSATKS